MVQSFTPELKRFKTVWGVDDIFDSSKWEDLFKRVVDDGFQGLEMHGLFFMMPGMGDALKKAGLELIGQVHTSSDVSSAENFKYMTTRDVQSHVESLRYLSGEAKKAGAIMINSHSGCDHWSIDQARDFLRQALEIEKELGIPVVHETHRRRLFWNPFNYRDILKGESSLSEIKVNLDISHWVVCLERCFGSEPSDKENGSDNDWWPEVLDMLKENCCLIHARVGYGEGPQVADPQADEYKNDVAAHLSYWSDVMKGMIAKNRICYVEPEHGPWPYQQSKPNTSTAPVTDIWIANNYVAKLVTENFKEIAPQGKC